MGDQRRFQEETQRDEMKVAETSLAADVCSVVWFAAAGPGARELHCEEAER